MSDITDPEIYGVETINGMKKTIDAQIIDYYIFGDGDSYDNHIFVVEVRVENIVYTVDRSYIDFVDLDRKLHKRYPKSAILPLPLDAFEVIDKILTNRERELKRRSIGPGKDNLTQARESILPGFDGLNNTANNFKIRPYFEEDIKSKVKNLDNYIVSLLTQHEIVSSDELLLFLDEEASSMEVDPSSLQPLSEYDLLLLNCPVNQCIVRRSEEHSFEIQAGQFILWRFSTIDFDIGFSVEMNDEIKVPYMRCKSHEKIICGTLESQHNATCKLKWDNSYAKLRTKQLSWVAKVVNPEEYQIAKVQAREVQREKKKFEDQRHALKRCTSFHSSLLSGVILNSSVVSEQASEDKIKLKELNDEIIKLNDNNYKLQTENNELKLELQNIQSIKQSIEDSRNQIMESWQFTVKQLDKISEDNKLLLIEIENEKRKYNLLLNEKKQIENDLIKALNDLKLADQREIELTDACKLALDQCDHDILQLKQSYDNDRINLESHYINIINTQKNIIENEIKLQYENEIIELKNKLNQQKNNIQTPKSSGFFSDTETETELYLRIKQLENDNNILLNENNILNNKLNK